MSFAASIIGTQQCPPPRIPPPAAPRTVTGPRKTTRNPGPGRRNLQPDKQDQARQRHEVLSRTTKVGRKIHANIEAFT
jgi:hypothetical protein